VQGLTIEDKRQYEAQAEKDKKRYAKALQVSVNASHFLAGVFALIALLSPSYMSMAFEKCSAVLRWMLCVTGA
jgi:hypothetical protein